MNNLSVNNQSNQSSLSSNVQSSETNVKVLIQNIRSGEVAGLDAADVKGQGAGISAQNATHSFSGTAGELGLNTTSSATPSGAIDFNSPEYADMSIQDKIFALMLSAIDKQEKSLESRFEQIAGQRAQMDNFNAASEQLNALAGQLDPTKPDSTVDISEATIQVPGQDGTPQTVNLAQYLKDSGLTLPEDPTKVNSETLSGIQSAVKDKTESISSTSQTDLLKLQTESSKLSRLYDMTTNMMKSMADSLANIVRNLGG